MVGSPETRMNWRLSDRAAQAWARAAWAVIGLLVFHLLLRLVVAAEAIAGIDRAWWLRY